MDAQNRERYIRKMVANLPTLRAKASMSQAKLAQIIGVSRQTVVAFESEKRAMSWNNFLSCFAVFQNNEETDQLLRLYEISTDELIDYLNGTQKGE